MKQFSSITTTTYSLLPRDKDLEVLLNFITDKIVKGLVLTRCVNLDTQFLLLYMLHKKRNALYIFWGYFDFGTTHYIMENMLLLTLIDIS